jgi:hypothetical protein
MGFSKDGSGYRDVWFFTGIGSVIKTLTINFQMRYKETPD